LIKTLNRKENRAIREFKDTLLRTFPGHIKTIKLYGSKARGDYREGSDIDMFVLVNKSDSNLEDKVCDLATEIFLQYGVLISPMVVSKKHFERLIYLQTAFIRNVEEQGVEI